MPCLVAAAGAVLFVGGCSNQGRARTPTPTYPFPPVDGCAEGPGRPGQGVDLVPRGAVSVTICTDSAPTQDAVADPPRTRSVLSGARLGKVVAALDRSTPDRRKVHSCDAGGFARNYTLVFTYRSGPPVSVEIDPDCRPSISNGSMSTDDAPAVRVVVDRLIGVRCSELIC